MRFTITLYVFMLVVSAFGQERAMIWYFGDQAGLDFRQGAPRVLNNGVMKAVAGCSCICDENSQLLFYTNGNEVWNRNHVMMQNGDSLLGSQLRNQNSVIVPMPLSDSVYYIFTVFASDTLQRFSYSVVNTNLDNGLGRVTLKNVPVSDNILEKIAAVSHCNKQDYWIITHGSDNFFYCYLFTDTGLVLPPVKSLTGTQPRTDIGYLKVSPAGDKVVIPINNDILLAEVFSFDNHTGMISQPVPIWIKEDVTYCNGIEFSPDGHLLYIDTGGRSFDLWQFNLMEKDVVQLNTSAISIASGNNFAMQLAPDGKIYIASENRAYLNAILDPDELGDACNYKREAIAFTHGKSLMGLPNFVQTWFYKPSFKAENTCLHDSVGFVFYHPETSDSIVWSFGDGSGSVVITGEESIAYHQFQSLGTYDVKVKSFHCGRYDSVLEQIDIYPNPVPSLVADTGICPGCWVALDAGQGFDSYLWNNGQQSSIITTNIGGTYTVEVGKDGCFTRDTAFVWVLQSVMEFPNAFTPNSDGLNDVFLALSNLSLANFSLRIVNRGGEIVFQSNDILKGWDGTVHGKLSSIGTFVWYAAYSYYNESGILVSQKKKGLVTLIR